jgi:putative tryptophan/tyrosine transport system substrate-binding protein
MTRRCLGLLVTLTLTGLVVPLVVEAQRPGKVPRIGILTLASATSAPLWAAFRQGLRDLGYVEGRNMRLEERFAEGQYERLPTLAAELVRLPVDVLVTDGLGAVAAKRATAVVPIVFAAFAQPVEEGLVASLARPGGNVTGFSVMAPELAGKRLELLREIVPGVRRMGIVCNPGRRGHAIQVQESQTVAARVDIHLEVARVHSPQAFDRAFQTMADTGVGAVILLDDAMFYNERTRIATLAAQRQTPAIYGHRGYVDAGGLLSYGPNFPDLFRRAATFVDQILKGATPADLPVQQPTTFELVINLKTAEALGLTIPPALLFQATEVIR